MAESAHSPLDPRGALLSDHPHPRPRLRRLTAGLIALGLAGDALGVVGLIVVGIGLKLPLLILMAPFLAILAAPLLMLSVLHPHITVYESGLWLQPLLWRGSWLPWEALARLTDHTLIQRGTRTRRERPRDGRLIVVSRGLPPQYRVVGLMAGLGAAHAFGIAAHAQRDYPALLQALQQHVPPSREHSTI